MKKIILIFTALFIAAGCAAGSKNIQNSLERSLVYDNDTLQNFTVDMCWWKSYKDTQLNNLITTALQNNTDLAKSAVDVRIALYQANLSGYDRLPSLSGDITAEASQKLTDGNDFSKTFSGEIALQYEADLWGRIRYSASAKKWEYAASVLDREAAQLALINSVIDVYYNLSYLNSYARTAENNVQNYKKIYDVTQIKYENGKVPKEDVLYASASLISAKNVLLELNTQIKSNEQTLRMLLNLTPSDDLRITFPDILDVSVINADIDVPVAALARRPDLKAAEYRLQKAFANEQSEKKGWYPSISIKTALASSSEKIGETFSVPFLAGSVSVNLPFLKWNTVKTKVKISKAEYEKAALDFEQNINTALNEIAYYYAAYLNNEAVFENARKKYEDTSEAAKYRAVRYENGKTDILLLLEALNMQNEDKAALLENKYKLIKCGNMIFKALAGKYEKI